MWGWETLGEDTILQGTFVSGASRANPLQQTSNSSLLRALGAPTL